MDNLLESGFAKMVKAPSVVTYLIPWSLSAVADGVSKGIFVVIQDLKKETWSVKEAKTVSEALAWTAGQDFWVNGVKVSRSATLTAQPLIQPGDTVLVKMGEKPTISSSEIPIIQPRQVNATMIVTGLVLERGLPPEPALRELRSGGRSISPSFSASSTFQSSESDRGI